MRLIVIALVVLVGGCASSPSPVEPPVSLKRIENAFIIKRVWRHDLGDAASDKYLKLDPLFDKNVIYSVDHRGLITAYALDSKDKIWETDIALQVGSAPSLYNGQLLVGTSQGKLVALDAKNGRILWSTQLGSEVLAAPKVAKGIIVVRCVNGYIYGLDEETGKQIWLHEQIIPALTLRGTSNPVIRDDIVLSSFDNGRLIANNLQTGQVLWQSSIAIPRGTTDLERMVDADADPVVVENVVYAVAFQGRLVAMQLGSGRIIWSRDLESYVGMSIDPYRIYLTDSEGMLWALDRTTGATLWKQDALLRRNPTRPTLHKQYLVVGDFNGYVHWLKRDSGKLVARVRLKDASVTTPTLDETEDLEFPRSNDILVPPIVNEDRLFVIDRHGHMEAFLASYP
jgi:outer membrane protein assembly factor BamB